MIMGNACSENHLAILLSWAKKSPWIFWCGVTADILASNAVHSL
jgi:hypothetical protein